MNAHQLTRRRVLTLTGGVVAAGLAGCPGDDTKPTDDHAEEHAGVVAEQDAYVVTYHWGFAAFDENGHDEHDNDDDHGHGDGILNHGFEILGLDVRMEVPWDKEEPVESTVVVEEPGTYEAQCTVGCGYYHTHQQEPLIEATDA